MSSLIEDKIVETLKQVRTVADQIMMREAVEILESSFYRRDGQRTEKILSKNLSENLYQSVQKIVSDPELQLENNFREYLAGLEDRLQNTKIIRFEVAFEPDENLIAEIGGWIERELGENIIMDFYLSPSIVGGAVIIYEGEYFNFILSAILERNFERSWQEVTKE